MHTYAHGVTLLYRLARVVVAALPPSVLPPPPPPMSNEGKYKWQISTVKKLAQCAFLPRVLYVTERAREKERE